MLDCQDILEWANHYHVQERSLDTFWAYFRANEQNILATLEELNRGDTLANISADAKSISLVFSSWPSLEEPRIHVLLSMEGERKYTRSAKGKGDRFFLAEYLVIFTTLGEVEKEMIDFM